MAVVCLHAGGEQRCSVVEMERAELALETLGMSVAEGKAMLHGVQDFMATQQVIEDLKRKRVCPNCGRRYHSKDAGADTVKTVFGAVEVPNPVGGGQRVYHFSGRSSARRQTDDRGGAAQTDAGTGFRKKSGSCDPRRC